ncbi:hypothetical protein FD755_025982, partial [Muntiacus reevesi]
ARRLPQQLKFTTSDPCDRIKDESELLQAQRHRMSYGLTAEMRKQAEVVQGLRGVCAQVLPRLAKPVTAPELNSSPPSLPAVSAGTGLLSLSALGSQARLSKEDKSGHGSDTLQDDYGEKSD